MGYVGRGAGGGGVEIIYLSLHCHHQNDLCIKADSDESHFRESHKTVSTDHNFSRERRAEAGSNRGPSAYSLKPYRQAKPAHSMLLLMIAFI